MRLLLRRTGTRRRLIGAVTAALLPLVVLTGIAESTPESAPPSAENVQAWRAGMIKIAPPPVEGCVTANYPRLAWEKIECVTAPSVPMAPKVPGPSPFIVGNGNSIAAQTPTPGSPITQAHGTFESVTGVANVRSPIWPAGPPVNNAYTYQLNTNFFQANECSGASIPAICLGWKQFVFANNGTSGALFVQYWLLTYNNTCPAGWTPYVPTATPWDNHCFITSTAAAYPDVPITNMMTFSNLRLTGVHNAGAGTDTAIFDSGTMLNASTGPSLATPTTPLPGWDMAEFNVFGYGNESQAEFNMNTGDPVPQMNVRLRIDYGGVLKPICHATGFTAETNNLSLHPPAPTATGTNPAILFRERKTGLPSVAGCLAAVAIGDTHQNTVAGLLYDFQATGDFDELLVGSAFQVQTRKVSGAPTWPNTSLNRSVGTRMGATRVAVCDGTNLVVDGRPTSLAPGGTLTLATGVTVRRDGNVYFVRDLAGNSIKVTPNTAASPQYTDLEVGLGSSSVVARGLLGNPGNNPGLLEGRDGTIYTVPLSFNDLYNRFGASWRVSPQSSLLQPCNAVAAGNPTAPFYSGNLPYTQRMVGENACRQAGVVAGWHDACVLDVAVVGQRAVATFVGRPAPVRNGNPPQPPPCSPAGCGFQPR
ncbi:MAG TPA: hypothetical protein VGD67_26770 [Pseudonocardiaceae bacterium]